MITTLQTTDSYTSVISSPQDYRIQFIKWNQTHAPTINLPASSGEEDDVLFYIFFELHLIGMHSWEHLFLWNKMMWPLEWSVTMLSVLNSFVSNMWSIVFSWRNWSPPDAFNSMLHNINKIGIASTTQVHYSYHPLKLLTVDLLIYTSIPFEKCLVSYYQQIKNQQSQTR